MFESDIPSERLSKSDQKFSVGVNSHEASGVRVKQGPSFPKMIIEVTAHEFILPLSCLLENLQNNGYEKPDEDCGNYNGVAKEVDLRNNLVSTTYCLVIVLYIVLEFWIILALKLRTMFSAQCFHYFWPILACSDSNESDESCSKVFKIGIFIQRPIQHYICKKAHT